MITFDPDRKISGPELVSILSGHDNSVLLDRRRAGRWLPPDQRQPGQGNYRKLSERDAATVVAASMMAGFMPGRSGGDRKTPLSLLEAADDMAHVLRDHDTWPDYAVWCHEDERVTFADDAETAVELSTQRGGGRIVPLVQAVAAVRQ